MHVLSTNNTWTSSEAYTSCAYLQTVRCNSAIQVLTYALVMQPAASGFHIQDCFKIHLLKICTNISSFDNPLLLTNRQAGSKQWLCRAMAFVESGVG